MQQNQKLTKGDIVFDADPTQRHDFSVFEVVGKLGSKIKVKCLIRPKGYIGNKDGFFYFNESPLYKATQEEFEKWKRFVPEEAQVIESSNYNSTDTNQK